MFSLLAIVMLGTRFVQGFIFWGGASRRLIYDSHEIAGVDHAVKLDFESTGFVANKLIHALPGTLYVIAARLVDTSGKALAEWDGATLAALSASAFENAYTCVWASQFKTETFGFGGVTGARAKVTLPAPSATTIETGTKADLVLEAINGARWQAPPVLTVG